MKLAPKISLFLLSLMIPCSVSRAIDLSGFFRLLSGTTEYNIGETDVTDQRFNLNLSQSLSPWLKLRLSYQYTKLATGDDQGREIVRRLQDPGIELLYNRPRLSAWLSLRDGSTSGTFETSNMDRRALAGNLSWTPKRAPIFSLNFRDDLNVADVGVFGREVRARSLNLSAVYNWRGLQTSYSYQQSRVENNLNAYQLDQGLHRARLDFAERFFEDRLSFSLVSWIERIEQTEETSAGVDLAEPIPARFGLFAIDTDPEIGELESNANLIDGNTTDPVVPLIEIGGANTFRNIGLDLGITREVTRLEISVDESSGADVLWVVYHSPDNLNWQRLAGSLSQFDGALLRYTVHFPKTTDRFFKAVNTTVNPAPEVAVTEIRALVDVHKLGGRDRRSTAYRADLAASYRPTDRLEARVTAGVNNNQRIADGLANRARDEHTLGFFFNWAMAPDLSLSLSHRMMDLKDYRVSNQIRNERLSSAALDWSPLPTVGGVVTLSQRDETDGGALIRATKNVRTQIRTDLLPDFRLISDLAYTDVEDPFSGYDLVSFRWREAVECFPTERWTAGGGLSITWYDSSSPRIVTRRTQIHLRTSWRATPYLSMSGIWDLSADDRRTTLSQRYGFSWTPGQKLSLSLSYQDSNTEDLRETNGASGSLNYRLTRKLKLLASFSYSTFQQLGFDPEKIRSLRAGFDFFF